MTPGVALTTVGFTTAACAGVEIAATGVFNWLTTVAEASACEERLPRLVCRFLMIARAKYKKEYGKNDDQSYKPCEQPDHEPSPPCISRTKYPIIICGSTLTVQLLGFFG